LTESGVYETKVGVDLELAAQLLAQGAAIAIPTETVYGLAANALEETAVLKIYKVKSRPLHNPLIVHVSDLSSVKEVVAEIPPLAEALMKQFPDGPITYLLPKSDRIPEVTCAGLPRVAVRIPSHPMAKALLQRLAFPLAAPSANPFGYISPTTAEHVFRQLKGKIPYILDGGSCDKGIESTILGFEGDKVTLYRHGSQSIQSIESIVGKISTHTSEDKNPQAPGMLSQHYSPSTKFVYGTPWEKVITTYSARKIGVIALTHQKHGIPEDHQYILSSSGDLDEAATHLYKAMHHLDAMNLDVIYAEEIPQVGIGFAIHDRLQRAAS